MKMNMTEKDEVSDSPGVISALESDSTAATIPPTATGQLVPFKPSSDLILAFTSICIITLAAALDATSLSIALPVITGELNGTAIEAFWAGTSFLLTSGVFQPVLAGVSHVFGRKSTLLLSNLLFALGAIVAALSRNFTTLLAGRSIQGIGGGGILAIGEIIVTDLVPLAVRGTWFGYLGFNWALGAVAGPLIGGAFTENVTWRWIFWINLPLVGVGSIAVILFLKLDKLPGTITSKIRAFDWVGSVVFVGSAVSFLVPLSWGGVMYPWNSWRTLFPLLLGVAGLVGFTVYEYRLSKRSRKTGYDEHEIIDPIVRFSIFSNSTLVITFAETVLHGIVVWSLLYFLPLYYETVKGYSPIISGIAILPETGLVAPVSVISAFVCTWSGRYRWALWTGWTLATFGSGILYLLGPGTSIPAWIFLNFPVSIGTGILFPVMGLGTQAACAPEDSGHAAAFFSFLRVFGQSIGLAISGVAFQNQLREALLPYPDLAPFATEYSKDATALVNIIKGMPQGSDRMDLIRAYSDALHVIWLLMTVLSGVGLISSFFTKEFSLQQEHSTKQRFVSLQS